MTLGGEQPVTTYSFTENRKPIVSPPRFSVPSSVLPHTAAPPAPTISRTWPDTLRPCPTAHTQTLPFSQHARDAFHLHRPLFHTGGPVPQHLHSQRRHFHPFGHNSCPRHHLRDHRIHHHCCSKLRLLRHLFSRVRLLYSSYHVKPSKTIPYITDPVPALP